MSQANQCADAFRNATGQLVAPQFPSLGVRDAVKEEKIATHKCLRLASALTPSGIDPVRLFTLKSLHESGSPLVQRVTCSSQLRQVDQRTNSFWERPAYLMVRQISSTRTPTSQTRHSLQSRRNKGVHTRHHKLVGYTSPPSKPLR